MDEKRWKIGELAAATGLTVRALHHYDEIGLLVPSERTQAGHRLYDEDDIRRLYEIRALRDLGVPLSEIPDALRDGARTTLERHLGRVEQDIDRGRRLRALLKGILEDSESASGQDYMEAIEAMTMFDKYYTADQLEQLEQRREELGKERHDLYHREWEELIAAAKAEQSRGTDPSDPRMQEIAKRWIELIELFTGGDEGILNSLKTMMNEEGPEKVTRGAVDPELQAYVSASIGKLGR
jgi:MerR family transcriptional regulator, thiopeptide resistance regulator